MHIFKIKEAELVFLGTAPTQNMYSFGYVNEQSFNSELVLLTG